MSENNTPTHRILAAATLISQGAEAASPLVSISMDLLTLRNLRVALTESVQG